MKFIGFPQTRSELGLFIIRLGIGLVFVIHGALKAMGGMETWVQLGSILQIFGITFAPAFWGLAATGIELFGGLALMSGIAPRIAAFFISCVMVVAISFHLHNGDAWNVVGYPISLFIVMIGILIGTVSRKQPE